MRHPRRKPRYHQIGTSDKISDYARSAQRPGKRLSSTRHRYYENRKNRTDMPGSRL